VKDELLASASHMWPYDLDFWFCIIKTSLQVSRNVTPFGQFWAFWNWFFSS